MPIYEYQCQQCETDFEVLVKSSETEVKCKNCGSKDLQRKFSVFGMKSGEKFRSSSAKSGCSSCSGGSCSSCSC